MLIKVLGFSECFIAESAFPVEYSIMLRFKICEF